MNILIATDGSEYSHAAIDECCRMIVDPDTANLLIVSVYESAYPLSAEPFALSVEYYQQLDEAVREQAADFISASEGRIYRAFPGRPVPVETEILRGSPARRIVEKAAEWGTDLIVVGSHGRGFWGRLLGSVSNAVVHHAPCSVLVVRKRM